MADNYNSFYEALKKVLEGYSKYDLPAWAESLWKTASSKNITIEDWDLLIRSVSREVSAIPGFITAMEKLSELIGAEELPEGFSSVLALTRKLAQDLDALPTTYSKATNLQNSTGAGSVQNTSSTASGSYSFAEGFGTKASGNYAHAGGDRCTASGEASVAFGKKNTASGTNSSATGAENTSSGLRSYVEGYLNVSNAANAHVEGERNECTGRNGHIEGRSNEASGINAHVEGGAVSGSNSEQTADKNDGNVASGDNSHVEGQGNKGVGLNSHIEGEQNEGSGRGCHLEGRSNLTDGEFTHVEGYDNDTYADHCHVEGSNNKVNSYDAESEYSKNCHVEGNNNTVSYAMAATHVEGSHNIADETTDGTHIEGVSNEVRSSRGIHIEGKDNSATNATFSHIEGQDNTTEYTRTHVGGLGNKASANDQRVFGTYNKDDSDALLIIGNGTDDENRSNALVVRRDGSVLGNVCPNIYHHYVSIRATGNVGETGTAVHGNIDVRVYASIYLDTAENITSVTADLLYMMQHGLNVGSTILVEEADLWKSYPITHLEFVVGDSIRVSLSYIDSGNVMRRLSLVANFSVFDAVYKLPMTLSSMYSLRRPNDTPDGMIRDFGIEYGTPELMSSEVDYE